MRNKKPLLFIILLFAIPFIIGKFANQSQTSAPVAPTPTPIPVTTNEVLSSDGTKKLIMQAQPTAMKTSYSFFITDTADGKEQPLFTKTDSFNTISLPENSWSPDNQYLFITTTEHASRSALVFQASGEPFANGQQYLDLGARFATLETEYMINDVTGWDSPTLIHVLTVKNDKTKGPAYWFEVPSQALIQLY